MKIAELTDEELFDELKKQVNLSRNNKRYDRERTQQIGEEMKKRGWKRPDLRNHK